MGNIHKIPIDPTLQKNLALTGNQTQTDLKMLKGRLRRIKATDLTRQKNQIQTGNQTQADLKVLKDSLQKAKATGLNLEKNQALAKTVLAGAIRTEAKEKMLPR